MIRIDEENNIIAFAGEDGGILPPKADGYNKFMLEIDGESYIKIESDPNEILYISSENTKKLGIGKHAYTIKGVREDGRIDTLLPNPIRGIKHFFVMEI